MGFFDDLPAAEPEPPRRHHPWDPPEAEFPGVVPTGALLLGRTEQAAVAITALTAFSNGFEIYLTARFRPGTGDDGPPGRGAANRSFRFGMQLPDGTKVVNGHDKGGPRGPRRDRDGEPAGPVLMEFMGGRGPHSQFGRWWAWPLPPPGTLEFVCEWPALGLAETRAAVDAQLILDAARRSVRLWPEDGG
jgi:hypothetical protein